MSKEHLPNRVVSAAVLAAAIYACGGIATPSPSPDSPSFTPNPTETTTPEPTYRPIEPIPTVVYPTFLPTPDPTPIPASELPKSGSVIARGPNDGKTEYITVDDCYSAADTKKAITTAYAMGAKITLFCIGSAIDNSSQASNMRLAQSYGFEIENHTYNHTSMTTKDVVYMKNQMAAQLNTVRKDLGNPKYKEYLIRPPFGAGTGNPYFWKAANTEHLRIVTWSISSGGTSDAYNTSEARIQLIMKVINARMLDKNGNLIGGHIILMHARPADMAALPRLIKEIQDKGGRFGLVGDLVGRPMTVSAEPQSIDNSLELVMTPKKDEQPPEIA